jgi:hypothetical protein
MKTYTSHGKKVNILNVNIYRANGYGQYTIVVDIECDYVLETLNIHTTDSQLFDDANDQDEDISVMEYLLIHARHTIESAIDNDDFISEFN